MNSLAKVIWNEKKPDEKLPIIEKILFNRGIITPEQKSVYINPSFENHLHDPMLMKDMRIGLKIISEAIKHKKKILVFGDYDADGVTATTLFYSFLKEINANCDYYIPHRIKDGYGITVDGVKLAQEKNVDVIVTVDNGIVAHDAIDKANELGISVVITDHHKAGDTIPNADAIINPNQPDCEYPFKGISGVGVAFKVIWELSKLFMSDSDRERFLKWNLDLVAMGTVADVMPLIDENRVLVTFGLKVISKSKRPGIKAILDLMVKDIDKKDATVIGFQLGPRINAAGRLEAADLALKTLLSEDYDDALIKARELNEINRKRQLMTEEAVKEAENQIDPNQNMIIIKSEHWHPGIIGLIAARLAENLHKPVLVFTLDSDSNVMKSSGRSPIYFDITKAIMSTKDLMINGGGHRQACGCSIHEANYDAFKTQLLDYANSALENIDTDAEINIETALNPDEINLNTFYELEKLSPFGQGFPDPIFSVKQVKLVDVRQVGYENKHILCTFLINNSHVKGIGFRFGDFAKNLKINDIVDIAFTLSKNEWQGRVSIQLIIKDIKK